jgi:hypothetical protein
MSVSNYQYDVTLRRMGDTTQTHRLVFTQSIERAIENTRKAFPGCLIINIILVPSDY